MNIDRYDAVTKELYRIHGLAALLELTDLDEYQQGVYEISNPILAAADAISESAVKCLRMLEDESKKGGTA